MNDKQGGARSVQQQRAPPHVVVVIPAPRDAIQDSSRESNPGRTRVPQRNPLPRHLELVSVLPEEPCHLKSSYERRRIDLTE